MSLPWPSQSDDLSASVVFVGILLAVLVSLLLGNGWRREGNVRLASPTFVPLDDDGAQQVATELGAAFNQYMRPDSRPGTD